MDDFCHGEALWDVDLTWNGDWPQFTNCFQHTVLVWVSCGFLWFTSVFYVCYLSSKPANVFPFTALFCLKLFSCGALFVLRIVQLLNIVDNSSTFDAEISDYVIHMVTYILVMGLLIMEKRKGVVASPVLFFFWLISLVVNVIPFYSKIKLQENEDDVFSFSIFYIVYGFILINFLLNCFAEKVPLGSYNTNGNPEVSASVLSRIVFWWTNRMLIQGYKGLQEDHLIPLNPRDTTATTVPVFQAQLKAEEDRCTQFQHPDQLESSFYNQVQETSVSKRKSLKVNVDEKTPLLQDQYSNGGGAELSHAASGSSKTRSGRISIYRVVLKTFWRQIITCHSIMILETVAVLVNPLILRAMIQFTDSDTDATWKGYLYAVAMFLMTCFQSLAEHAATFYTISMAMRVSSSVTSTIYRKALTMNSEARRESTVGEIVNLMSVDARNIEIFTTYSFWLWMSPAWGGIALYLLYTTVGVSMFAGLAFMALLFVINTFLMNKLRIYEKAAMTIRDTRVKVINEVLNGIKILKLYAWEPSFEEKVDNIRNEELVVRLKSSFIESFLTFAWTAALYWMTLFTFMTYVYVDESHNLDASTSFVALSYFNIIRLAVNVLPVMIREGVKCIVSVGRVNKFLNTPDLDTSNISKDTRPDNAIEITDATFTWDTETTSTLKDINLRVKRGSLVAVVGQVGAGKSSLVSSMLGEMETVSGHVNISGSIAYVPQQAWIQNDTLRNNILFGCDFDQQRYDKVLEACALKPDLEILAAGDMTEIGEKGINLSGGQKQRVSVARAVYSDADVILLDDPLSAVDSHVGKHIFHEVLNQGGLLQGKTRVLVTHGLQWLPKVDNIVVLNEGRISEMGTYDQLMTHDGPFAQFLTTYLTQHDESDSEDEDEEAQNVKRDILQRLVSVHSESEADEPTKDRILKRLKSRESESEHHDLRHRKRSRGESESSTTASGGERRQHREKRVVQDDKDKKDLEEQSKIITEEEMESGRVDMGVYMELGRAMGLKYSLLMLFLYTIYNVGALGGNLWLSAWTDDKELTNTTSLPPDSSRRRQLNDFYLGIYAALGVGQTVFIIIYSVIMAFRHIHASRLMHRKMLQQLLRAPMSFFDTTPLGRIVNRFSQDMDMLDSEVCLNIEIWVDNLEQVLATVVAISYTTPIFLAVFAPAFIIYYFLLRFYIGTSCQIRRLQSKKRSPIYSHFGETLTGTHVIRAYGAQQRFTQQSEDRMDALFTCTYNSNAAARFWRMPDAILCVYIGRLPQWGAGLQGNTNTIRSWLGVRLDFIGSILILAAALFTVSSRDTMSAGIVGLSLSYALEVTGRLNMVVRMSTEMETNIVSVERIAEYTRVETEASWTAIPRPKPDWPQHGHVRFQGYSTRYRQGLDLVLNDLTCDFKAGEKVGIVGRTGAGKSSMTLAVFRLIEPAGGKIFVDDVDITSLGLHDLRNKLNILPQDPVIFDGTIRMNLDPFDTHNDQQVWTALEQAHLKDYVQGLPEQLNHVCGEGGENLSVGQRQLLCLARALLRKTKILILDEATAAVDMETDDLIQNTIREAFTDCTILTIAHRINTVMDYDRILVLENGRIMEFGAPSALLNDSDGAFYKMAKDAGLI